MPLRFLSRICACILFVHAYARNCVLSVQRDMNPVVCDSVEKMNRPLSALVSARSTDPKGVQHFLSQRRFSRHVLFLFKIYYLGTQTIFVNQHIMKYFSCHQFKSSNLWNRSHQAMSDANTRIIPTANPFSRIRFRRTLSFFKTKVNILLSII